MSAPRGRSRSPRVLVLAGLEPTGRMGLLADLATIHRLGGRGVGIATALTAQGRHFLLEPVRASVIARQIGAALEEGPVDAIKLGVVPNRVILAVARRLLPQDVPWVIDPVVFSSTGHRLSRLTPRDYLRLANSWTFLTPNRGELAWLAGVFGERSSDNVATVAQVLQGHGDLRILVKGGHSKGAPVDLLCDAGRVLRIPGPRLRRSRVRHRGTGCRHASAFAVALGRGASPAAAARAAKAWVERYLTE